MLRADGGRRRQVSVRELVSRVERERSGWVADVDYGRAREGSSMVPGKSGDVSGNAIRWLVAASGLVIVLSVFSVVSIASAGGATNRSVVSDVVLPAATLTAATFGACYVSPDSTGLK